MSRRHYSSAAAATTLSSGVGSGDTTLVVGAITGLPVQFPYALILDPDSASEEVVDVTAGSGTTLTVTRGVDGTTAVAHTAGAVVQHGVSARDFDEPNAHIAETTTAHGVTFTDLLTTTNSKVVTNKDLSSATNTFPAALSRGKLGYAEVTANQASIGTTTVDLTNLSAAATVGASRRVRVTAQCGFVAPASACIVQIFLMEGATQIKTAYLTVPASASVTLTAVAVLAPSAGAHTYKVAATCSVASATLVAAATDPAFILVEDIGAA